MNVKNKVAIVTGASSGIGLATAKLLANEGAKVALVARSGEVLKKVSKELPNAIAIVADMSKEKEIVEMVKTTVKHFGQINILVNNAGIGYDAPIEKIDSEKYRYLSNLDVIGPLIAMQQVIPVMKKAGGGSIINISSGTALVTIPGIGAYSSLKRALAGLSLTAREELSKDKIIVSVVYPYITDTNFYKNKLSEGGEDREDFYRQGDTAEHVAGKILEAIKTGEAEVYARDFMRRES